MSTYLKKRVLTFCFLLLFVGGISSNLLFASSVKNFQRVRAVNSLSQYSVLCMVQDSTGFLWFGTKDGLNRFDGYEFITFKYEPGNSNSLSNNEISCLAMQGDRYLWIGTRSGGINRLELYSNEITRYTDLTYDDLVRDIFYDEHGQIWAGTSEGLFLFQENGSENGSFINISRQANYRYQDGKAFLPFRKNIAVTFIYQITPNKLIIGAEEGLFEYNIHLNEFRSVSDQTINHTVITKILMDSRQQLWVATYDGLLRFDDISGGIDHKIVFYDSNAASERRLPVDWVEDMVEDHKGNIWLATRGGGVVIISDNKVQQVFDHSVVNSAQLPDNIINSIMIDNTGVLWLGTESNELIYLDLYAKQFMTVLPGSENSSGLSDNLVTALTGNGKFLWAGTSSAGIDIFVIKGDTIKKVRNFPRIFLPIEQWKSEIYSLLCDDQDNLWVGSATNTLIRYTPQGHTDRWPVEGFVFSLFEDNRGNIWFGTWGQGLGYVKKETLNIVQYNKVFDGMLGISSDKVLTIFQDSRDLLWVGTKGGGISVADIDGIINGSERFTVYRHSPQESNSLSYNDIYDIFEDSNGNIWLASGRGLNRLTIPEGYNFKNTVLSGKAGFEVISENDGLPGGMVYSIREDHKGMLWLGTNNGLTRYNPFDASMVIYDVNDGLPSGKFHLNSSYQNEDNGMLYFGGVDGISFFHPDSIFSNPFNANTKITELLLLNRSVLPKMKIAGREILSQDIANTEKIRISHYDKEISLKFSALHFASPDKIRYSYRLLGFNDEWQQVGSQNRWVTYTNLRYGKYMFQVRATNNDGIQEPGVSELLIIVDPPIWLTSWAYLVYIIILFFLLYVFRKYSLIAVKKKNQLIIESMEHKKETEIAETKMRFFTNVSHEIRTPLALINAPLQQLIKDESLDPKHKSTLNMIYRNVRRLLNQVNQLLEFRKMEADRYELKYSYFSLDQLFREILLDFDSIIKQKDIQVELKILDDLEINADKRLVTTAFHNLISNSLKFSPSKGSFIIEVENIVDSGSSSDNNEEAEKMVKIRFIDEGPGIPESHLESVFGRFFQINHDENDHLGGSGIGLSIVREFIEKHSGKVRAFNMPSKGCCFEVILPLGDKIPTYLENLTDEVEKPDIEDVAHKEEEKDKPLLCIVEDDQDMAIYLRSVFKEKFKVTLFFDGKKAHEQIHKILPDLIICDVMLPGMNGIDLTRKLKNNQNTSHIPIVMLTARAGQDHILEGLNTGADSYILKPFDIDLLQAQIRSLMKSREAFRQRFSQKLYLEPSEEVIMPMDEKFLSRLMSITEENLANASFDVSNLVSEMHMSHSIILKKVKSLTGLSLVEFIRSMRIKKAAQIFRQDKLSVSEVAFMVGFSDPKYFSKCFVKDMGIKPSEFIRQHHG